MSEITDAGGSDELVRLITDKMDDIDAIYLIYDHKVAVRDLNGNVETFTEVAGIVQYCCGGSPRLLHAVDVELLLNHEGIRKLRIPFRLLTPGMTLPQTPTE